MLEMAEDIDELPPFTAVQHKWVTGKADSTDPGVDHAKTIREKNKERVEAEEGERRKRYRNPANIEAGRRAGRRNSRDPEIRAKV